MAKKKTPTVTELAQQAEAKLDALLGDNSYISNADVRRARGKEPNGPPSVGRTTKDGKTRDRVITVPPMRTEIFQVGVAGIEPLILHAWSKKTTRQILIEHTGLSESTNVKKKAEREEKDPFDDFLGTLYADHEGYLGFPTRGFKAALVAACRFVPKVSMTDLLPAVHVHGHGALVPIWGQPVNRLDPVKIGPYNDRTVDLRFRAEIPNWMAVLTIRHDPDVIKADQILHLIQRAGMIGVGEWRPDRGNNNGLFELVSGGEAEIERLKQELGRCRKSDLTVENSGTIELLEDLGLAEPWLARRKARLDQAAASAS